MKTRCESCLSEIEIAGRIGFNQACPSCGAWLHSCLMCRFWSDGRCLETSAEKVGEPEGKNFCEWFQGRDPRPDGKGTEGRSREAAEEMWRRLTKK